MTIDIQLFYLFNSLAGQLPVLDWLIVFLASYVAYILITVFLVLLLFSKYSRQEKLRVFIVTVTSAVIARLGVTELIRFFYQRPRPLEGLQVYQLLTSSEWSFPSGHATFFFAMATAIYLYNKKWGVGFFIVAILMTLSRVIAGIHYPSDIIGGALIGIAVACIVFYLANRITPTQVQETAIPSH
jgi:undecaprenyl-diphosphatase